MNHYKVRRAVGLFYNHPLIFWSGNKALRERVKQQVSPAVRSKVTEVLR